MQAFPIPYPPARGDRQDHKDSLNRYVRVEGREMDKDHYLNPEDGKLVLLRVQCAKNYVRPQNLATTWSDPLEPNPLARAWKAFRESPRRILTWTYSDRLRARSVVDGSINSPAATYNPSGEYTKDQQRPTFVLLTLPEQIYIGSILLHVFFSA